MSFNQIGLKSGIFLPILDVSSRQRSGSLKG
jgi:hypothetical protein